MYMEHLPRQSKLRAPKTSLNKFKKNQVTEILCSNDAGTKGKNQ